MTLVLPRKGTLGVNDKQPFVYIKCGHVHGQHQWGQGDDREGRTCPLCLTVSYLFGLDMSLMSQFIDVKVIQNNYDKIVKLLEYDLCHG